MNLYDTVKEIYNYMTRRGEIFVAYVPKDEENIDSPSIEFVITLALLFFHMIVYNDIDMEFDIPERTSYKSFINLAHFMNDTDDVIRQIEQFIIEDRKNEVVV